MRVGSIVEGHGEVKAVPVLLRRLATELGRSDVQVAKPVRVPRGRLLKQGEIERYVELQARDLGSEGRLVVIVDADDDCPAELGPELLTRCRSARADLRTSVVIANREFEAWFLAGASSLAGQRGLDPGLTPPPDPESVRDAKGWLQRQRVDGRAYSETTDQPALAARFDVQVVRSTSPSFDKLWRDLTALLQ